MGHFGSVGVFVFFTISGYIMLHTCMNNFANVKFAIQFIIRRIVRIAPLYYIGTLLILMIMVFDKNELNITFMLKSILFVPYYNFSEGGGFYPILGVGWTLNFEMFFYSIFAISLLFKKRFGLLFSCITIISITILGFIIKPDHSEYLKHTIFAFYMQSTVALFVAGILMRYFDQDILLLFEKIHLRNGGVVTFFVPWIVLVGVTVGVELMGIKSGGPKILELFAVLPLLLVAGCDIRFPRMINNVMTFLGDASYSIYIFHGLVLNIMMRLWGVVGLGYQAEKILAGVIVSVFVSCVFYLLVERNLHRFFELPIRRVVDRMLFSGQFPQRSVPAASTEVR
jgi:peptidoglycan/LPS O-acetylase OafA/YrhL